MSFEADVSEVLLLLFHVIICVRLQFPCCGASLSVSNTTSASLQRARNTARATTYLLSFKSVSPRLFLFPLLGTVASPSMCLRHLMSFFSNAPFLRDVSGTETLWFPSWKSPSAPPVQSTARALGGKVLPNTHDVTWLKWLGTVSARCGASFIDPTTPSLTSASKEDTMSGHISILLRVCLSPRFQPVVVLPCRHELHVCYLSGKSFASLLPFPFASCG